MSTLTTNVKIIGFDPEVRGNARAEATTIDMGPGESRQLFNTGPDNLIVYAVEFTDDARHKFTQRVEVEPGKRLVVNRLSKLASVGESNVTIGGQQKADA